VRAIGAIFQKQLADLPKNLTVSLIYILFPAMAFIMGSLQGYMAEQMAMFAAISVGVVPMCNIAVCVAEDREYKSLRFLVMAGVKPVQYLIGLMGFVCVMTLLPMAFYAFFGEFAARGILLNMMVVSLLGIVASAILGGAIGIFAKNVQQATAIYTPLMLGFVLLPMIAGINETIGRIIEFLFPSQIFIIALTDTPDLARALIIIGANIVALLVFFIFAYKKKGLRG
jgi:ABC-2 type transport system permease protein